jgi:hypothetical protein
MPVHYSLVTVEIEREVSNEGWILKHRIFSLCMDGKSCCDLRQIHGSATRLCKGAHAKERGEGP